MVSNKTPVGEFSNLNSSNLNSSKFNHLSSMFLNMEFVHTGTIKLSSSHGTITLSSHTFLVDNLGGSIKHSPKKLYYV